MIETTLKKGEKYPLAATARYFVVRAVGDGVAISVRNAPEVQLQNSDVIDLLGSDEITLVNTSEQPQNIKFQLSPFKIEVGAAKNNIKAIEDTVTVQMDRDVNIGAVNQDGEWVVGVNNLPPVAIESLPSVALRNATTNTHKPRVECLAGVATKLFSANPCKSKRLNIRSDQLNGVSLGGSAVNDSSGGYLDVGMVDYIDTSGELWAFNNGSQSVFVDVLELV